MPEPDTEGHESNEPALFAGCRDNQTSAGTDIGGSDNGSFTYYIC